MPANLTPMYRKAERDYRRAQTPAERVECLQRMMQLIPRHKGTDKLQAAIKSSLSEARADLKRAENAPRATPFLRIPRHGCGRVLVVGAANAGKSQLVATLTNAAPEVAPFPFTTREPFPAMMPCQGVQIQLIDTPPVVADALPPWLLNLVRTADAVVLAMDGSSDDAPQQTHEVVRAFEERRTRFSDRSGFDAADFGVAHVPALLVVTRADDADSGLRTELLRDEIHRQQEHFSLPSVAFEPASAAAVAATQQAIFGVLKLVRVFTKRPGQEPDLTSPLTIAAGGTVEDLALQIHEDLARKLRHARLWGRSDHEGQVVGRDYVLHDGDIVELH